MPMPSIRRNIRRKIVEILRMFFYCKHRQTLGLSRYLIFSKEKCIAEEKASIQNLSFITNSHKLEGFLQKLRGFPQKLMSNSGQLSAVSGWQLSESGFTGLKDSREKEEARCF